MNHHAYHRTAALAVLLVLAASVPAQAIGAKRTPSTFFLYRPNVGPYARIQGALTEVREHVDELGIDGPLMAIYYDNPARTAPSLQKADIGVRISKEEALRLLREARSEAPEEDRTEEALLEEIREYEDRGATLEDPWHVKILPERLVAAATVRAPFLKIPETYAEMHAWIWANGYYLVGPVTEVYLSPPGSDGTITAEIQIGIDRTGVPDRR